MERRELLRGVAAIGAVGAAPPLLAGCGEDAATDGASVAPTPGDAIKVDLSTIDDGSFVVTQQVVVIKDGERVRAYSAICPHQGCAVNDVADGVIACPCHGSTFAVADGEVTGGPATRGLTPATVAVEGTTATITIA